jgi:hypothetical protein
MSDQVREVLRSLILQRKVAIAVEPFLAQEFGALLPSIQSKAGMIEFIGPSVLAYDAKETFTNSFGVQLHIPQL